LRTLVRAEMSPPFAEVQVNATPDRVPRISGDFLALTRLIKHDLPKTNMEGAIKWPQFHL
jgi:hypothetical protein